MENEKDKVIVEDVIEDDEQFNGETGEEVSEESTYVNSEESSSAESDKGDNAEENSAPPTEEVKTGGKSGKGKGKSYKKSGKKQSNPKVDKPNVNSIGESAVISEVTEAATPIMSAAPEQAEITVGSGKMVVVNIKSPRGKFKSGGVWYDPKIGDMKVPLFVRDILKIRGDLD